MALLVWLTQRKMDSNDLLPRIDSAVCQTVDLGFISHVMEKMCGGVRDLHTYGWRMSQRTHLVNI